MTIVALFSSVELEEASQNDRSLYNWQGCWIFDLIYWDDVTTACLAPADFPAISSYGILDLCTSKFNFGNAMLTMI